MEHETHIVSLIIYIKPGYKKEILHKAYKFPWAECHTEDEVHKVVLVFEVESEAGLASSIDEINSWQGVLSTQFCYHHCESNESLQEEIQYANHAS